MCVCVGGSGTTSVMDKGQNRPSTEKRVGIKQTPDSEESRYGYTENEAQSAGRRQRDELSHNQSLYG